MLITNGNDLIQPNTEVDDIEARLAELKRQKLHRLKNQPHRYYIPIGKTEAFIKKAFSGDYLIGLFSAANGVGKTEGMVEIMAHLIWPVGNEFMQAPLLTKWPYLKKIRIVAPATTIKETTIPAMKRIFPKGKYNVEKYETSKDGKSYEAKWTCYADDGEKWEIDVMTYDQDPAQFESANIGLILMDEPPPYAIYKACISRLRRGGLLLIFATPLMGSGYMYDEIVVNPDAEKLYRFHMTADVEEACVEHGDRGFLEHKHIEMMVMQYTEDEREARVHGRFQHLTGLIFKMFKPELHILPQFTLNPRDWCVKEFYDTHPRNPEAVMYIAYNRKGTHIICDEIYKNDLVTNIATEMKSIEREKKYRITRRGLDPSGFNVDNRRDNMPKELNIGDILASNGLKHDPASKARSTAIKRTQEFLSYKEKNGLMLKPPQLYVFDHCHRTIWEFTHWQWNEWTGKTAQDRSPSERPQDKDDHMMENIGRALLDDTSFKEMVTAKATYNRTKQNIDPYR